MLLVVLCSFLEHIFTVGHFFNLVLEKYNHQIHELQHLVVDTKVNKDNPLNGFQT